MVESIVLEMRRKLLARHTVTRSQNEIEVISLQALTNI